jgi:hypothetical protein
MKPETKIKILLAFLIPLAVIVCSGVIMATAQGLIDRFATREYVVNNYLTKQDAEKLFFSKAEGSAQTEIINSVKEQVGFIRGDIKTVVTVVLAMDKKVDNQNDKIDKYIIMNQQIVQGLTRQPPKPPKPPPIKIVSQEE